VTARPLLNPVLRTVWRDQETLQLGLDPERALVLSGLTGPLTSFLATLDGSRTTAGALAEAQSLGLATADAIALLRALEGGGALLDGAADRAALARLAPAERARLDPDLASWSVNGCEPAERLASRGGARVLVRGAGRVGAALAALLAAAGVGRVIVEDERPVRPADAAPGGHQVAAVGQLRSHSIQSSAQAAAPTASVGPGSAWDGPAPDVVALCPDGPATAGDGADLLTRDVAHVVVTTYERVGVVGPFVRPGRSACLTCLEQHRVDRDPAWPVVSAQLRHPARRTSGSPFAAACDVVLAASVSALGAAAVLAALDEPDADHELSGALIELRPPSLLTRRRSWPPHPCCGCGWPGGRPMAASGSDLR
jgi:bacteriocin biosynthesis cyclodehydratase domain-containing protein